MERSRGRCSSDSAPKCIGHVGCEVDEIILCCAVFRRSKEGLTHSMSRCLEKGSRTNRISSSRRHMVNITASSSIKPVMFVGESRAVTGQASHWIWKYCINCSWKVS